MQQTIQNTARNLVGITKRVFETFTMEEIVAHHKISTKNLYELLAPYPNQGVGFKIWRKTWSQDRYIIIKQAEFKGLRSGKLFGVEYHRSKKLDEAPVRVRNGNKRGIWRYDVNGSSAITQNNLYYPAEVIQQYMEQNRNVDTQKKEQDKKE